MRIGIMRAMFMAKFGAFVAESTRALVLHLASRPFLEDALLHVAEGAEKSLIVGYRFLDQLAHQRHLGIADYAVDTLGKGLERVESFKSIADEEHGRVAPLDHRHSLQGLQTGIVAGAAATEHFFHHHDFVIGLVEARVELRVTFDDVNFVAEFQKCGAGQVEPFNRADGQQGRFVGGRNKIKFFSHDYFNFKVIGSGGPPLPVPRASVFIFNSVMGVVVSPRAFLILSTPREITPRLVQ